MSKHLVGITGHENGFHAVCYTCFWKGPVSVFLREVNADRRDHLAQKAVTS